jgi:Arc/MetJ family transcription regulator
MIRTTISIDEKTFDRLMQLAGTDNKTEAVNKAIMSFIRQERLMRFKKLRGKLDLPTNEALETGELERAKRLAGENE